MLILQITAGIFFGGMALFWGFVFLGVIDDNLQQRYGRQWWWRVLGKRGSPTSPAA